MADATLKVSATRANIAKLNPARRAFWTRKLDALEKRNGLKVGEGEYGSSSFQSEDRWLRFANDLDRMYTAVAQEATQTRKDIVRATADATESIGWGLWPLAIAALAIGFALSKGRGR